MKHDRVKLKDVASRIQYGYTASASNDDIGPRFLRITDIVPEQIDWENVPFCPIEDGLFDKYALHDGDIVIARTGNTTGYAKLIRDEQRAVFASYLIRVQLDQQKAVPGYVGRLVESDIYKRFVNSQKGGSAQGNANAQILTQFEFDLPPLGVQRKIAEVLATYDDLLANNHRRMALLEESARLLYQEWFVHLRFPGHEHKRLINGIPEGWGSKTLSDICSDIREMVLPESLDSGTPYIGLEHMPRRSISLAEWGMAQTVSSSKCRYRKGDILFGKIRPYFHKVGVAFTDGVTSSDAIVIRSDSDSLRAFALMTVSSDKFVAEASQTMREGSKMPRADWKLMRKYPIVMPPQGLLDNFAETITAITEQLSNLCFQNQKLRAARDILLPRLMNGEVVA
jgi:type I restriction enzyme S subunit